MNVLQRISDALRDEVTNGDAVNFWDDEVDTQKLAIIALHALMDSGTIPVTLMMHQLSVDEERCTCQAEIHGALFAHQAGIVYAEMLRED